MISNGASNERIRMFSIGDAGNTAGFLIQRALNDDELVIYENGSFTFSNTISNLRDGLVHKITIKRYNGNTYIYFDDVLNKSWVSNTLSYSLTRDVIVGGLYFSNSIFSDGSAKIYTSLNYYELDSSGNRIKHLIHLTGADKAGEIWHNNAEQYDFNSSYNVNEDSNLTATKLSYNKWRVQSTGVNFPAMLLNANTLSYDYSKLKVNVEIHNGQEHLFRIYAGDSIDSVGSIVQIGSDNSSTVDFTFEEEGVHDRSTYPFLRFLIGSNIGAIDLDCTITIEPHENAIINLNGSSDGDQWAISKYGVPEIINRGGRLVGGFDTNLLWDIGSHSEFEIQDFIIQVDFVISPNLSEVVHHLVGVESANTRLGIVVRLDNRQSVSGNYQVGVVLGSNNDANAVGDIDIVPNTHYSFVAYRDSSSNALGYYLNGALDVVRIQTSAFSFGTENTVIGNRSDNTSTAFIYGGLIYKIRFLPYTAQNLTDILNGEVDISSELINFDFVDVENGVVPNTATNAPANSDAILNLNGSYSGREEVWIPAQNNIVDVYGQPLSVRPNGKGITGGSRVNLNPFGAPALNEAGIPKDTYREESFN